ncbi:GHMP kinase [Flavobacterium sp. J49]|uniref:GYDIA family GHMP kinase n=1 Tax=Flavobacterium sp. J49 TaxID=2718534 RepID=UPI0015942F9C|nr:GYDIA family GHMP kinase [Flavobacterium sp. J49]MBF6641836.1 GHMP kinase [Flavobacterium sp. J49]NIC03083.1 GHMP kinase [Flavobacterium sp. J49]
MKKSFYSNGKLLITGEYVVLDGAQAFALPTKYGQNLIIEEADGDSIQWTSYDSDKSVWFEDIIPFASIVRKERHDDAKSIKNTLIEILHEAYLMNSDFITQTKGYKITTELTFPKSWGLGTSSTLINNIAQWLQIDAFELLKRSFGGSGYDIACAQNNSGILYQIVDEKPVVEIVNFNPDFTDKIFFVYLNKKQNSRNAIASYYSNQVDIRKTIPVINELTKTVVEAEQPKTFALALAQHEIALSNILELSTVKETLFHDFDGVIKSLGAWGGDFVLSISKENPTDYFKEKGFEIVIPYHEMIL